MRFIVMGAGALGCYVAGRLAAGSRQVTLVGRPAQIRALQETGLRVTDLQGFDAQLPAHAMRLATSLAALTVQARDVVLLCVATAATESAALEIGACCPAGTTVVSLQNGVDNVVRLQAIAPRVKVLAGMVACSVVMLTPRRVHRATPGPLHVARNSISGEMALLFNACGLTTILADDMRPLQWGKLLLNLNHPVHARSDVPLRLQLMDRDYRRQLAALQTEALAVMKRAGIQPARITAVAPSLLPLLLRLPNWLFRWLPASVLRMNPSAQSCLLDCGQRGRDTEVTDLCAAVVHLATRHGSSAPRSAAMCQLMQGQQTGPRMPARATRSAAPP